MSPLILKRGDPSRRRDDDYDVLENGKVVGRIFHLDAAAPDCGRAAWRAHQVRCARLRGYARTGTSRLTDLA